MDPALSIMQMTRLAVHLSNQKAIMGFFVILMSLLGACTGTVKSDQPIVEADASLSNVPKDDAGVVDDPDSEPETVPADNTDDDGDKPDDNNDSSDRILQPIQNADPEVIDISNDKIDGGLGERVELNDGDRVLGVGPEGDIWVYRAHAEDNIKDDAKIVLKGSIETYGFNTGLSATFSDVGKLAPGFDISNGENVGRTEELRDEGTLFQSIHIESDTVANIVSGNHLWRTTNNLITVGDDGDFPDQLLVVKYQCGGRSLNQPNFLIGLVCGVSGGNCLNADRSSLDYSKLNYAMFERVNLPTNSADTNGYVWVSVGLPEAFKTADTEAQLNVRHLSGACLTEKSPLLTQLPDDTLLGIVMHKDGTVGGHFNYADSFADTKVKFTDEFAIDETAGFVAKVIKNGESKTNVLIERTKNNGSTAAYFGKFSAGDVGHVAAGGGYIFASVGGKLYRNAATNAWNKWSEIKTGEVENIDDIWGTAIGQAWVKRGNTVTAVIVRSNRPKTHWVTVRGIHAYERFYPNEIAFEMNAISNVSSKIKTVTLFFDDIEQYYQQASEADADGNWHFNVGANIPEDVNEAGWHNLIVKVSFGADEEDIFERHFPFRVIGDVADSPITTVPEPTLVTFAEVSAIAGDDGSDGRCMNCHNSTRSSGGKDLTVEQTWIEFANDIYREINTGQMPRPTDDQAFTNSSDDQAEKLLLLKYLRENGANAP